MPTLVRIIVALALAIFSLFVLLPTAIAVARNHPNTTSIALWNTVGLLLFGLGWLIALVKALTDGPSITANVVVQNILPESKEKN